MTHHQRDNAELIARAREQADMLADHRAKPVAQTLRQLCDRLESLSPQPPAETGDDDAELLRDIAKGPLPSDFTDETKARLEAIASRLSSAGDDELVARLVLALEPLALLAGDTNMHDPLSKWFRVGHLFEAKDAIAEALSRKGRE